MMELTEQAQAALADAKRLAKRLGDNYIGTEHLLVALVRQEDSLAAKVLQGLGVSEKNLIDLIEELISPEGGIAVAEWDGNTPKLDQMQNRKPLHVVWMRSVQSIFCLPWCVCRIQRAHASWHPCP